MSVMRHDFMSLYPPPEWLAAEWVAVVVAVGAIPAFLLSVYVANRRSERRGDFLVEFCGDCSTRLELPGHQL